MDDSADQTFASMKQHLCRFVPNQIFATRSLAPQPERRPLVSRQSSAAIKLIVGLVIGPPLPCVSVFPLLWSKIMVIVDTNEES